MKLNLDRQHIINEELNELLTKNIKAKVAFKVGKFKLKIHELVQLYEQNRNKLFETYHTKIVKNEQGHEQYVVEKDHENYSKFIEEMKELNSIETEVEDFSISIADLENVDLSPKFFINMGDLITE